MSVTLARKSGPRRSIALASFLLTLGLVACNGSASPTAAPSVAVPTVAPSVAVPTAPASLARATASPASAGPTLTPPPSLKPLTLLWQKGGPTPSKAWAFQPTFDPVSGDIWVAASFDNKFWIFSPDGTYLESWGTPGKGDGQLALTTHEQNPAPFGSIAFTADGGFYVANIGNNRVDRFDSHRHFVASFGGFGHANGQFTRAWGVRTDGTTIYVSDDDQNVIEAFDMAGHWLRTLPWGDAFFALDAAGRIVSVTGTVDQADAVVVLDPVTGQKVRTFPFPPIAGQALGIAVDAAGHIFVTIAQPENAPDVPVATIEMDANGKTIGSWSTAGETIALAPDGTAIYYGSSWAFIRKYALPTL